MSSENEVNSQPAPRVKLVSVEQMPSVTEEVPVYGPNDAANIARSMLERKDREHFIVMHLNGAHRIASCEVVSVGTLTDAQIHPREVFKGALLANAACIVCAHNHPSGSLEPSDADRRVFDVLAKAGKVLGVSLLDFLIVSPEGSWSASENWAD